MGTTNKWIDFWNNQKVFKPIAFDKCMEIFIEGTEDLIRYSATDDVLDIGSGPGALPFQLKNRVKSMQCLDVSERYLEFCKERFKDFPNITFGKLNSDDYTNLSAVGEKKFSLITCLSVIQYFKSKQDVERLILNVQKVSRPGSRFFISDIPCRTSLVHEVFTHFYEGIKRGYFFEMLVMLIRARFSDYTEVRKSSGILSYTENEVQELIKKMGLNAKIIKKRLTTNGGRLHLLIQF